MSAHLNHIWAMGVKYSTGPGAINANESSRRRIYHRLPKLTKECAGSPSASVMIRTDVPTPSTLRENILHDHDPLRRIQYKDCIVDSGIRLDIGEAKSRNISARLV